MKTFAYDQHGNLTVKNVTTTQDEEGADVVSTTQTDISPEQLAVHLPMYIAEMTGPELLQAQAIIKAL